MSLREGQIPLALWISAALVCHALGGDGAREVAETALDKKDLWNLVKLERQTLRPEDKTFEVLLPDQVPTPTNQDVAAPDKESDPTDEDVDEADKKPEQPQQPKPKKEEEAKPAPPEVAQKPAPEKKKEPVLVPVVPVPPAPAPPPPPPERRIAVIQHAEKNQPDNPSANRVADDANHVAEETMAKIRSHDQDMANPSAGAPKALGPELEKGNSDKDKEAESEDKIGNDDHSPGENSKTGTDAQHATPAIPGPPMQLRLPPPMAPRATGTGGKFASGPVKAPGGPPPSPGGQGPTASEVQTGGDKQGGWSMDPVNPGGDGSSRVAGRRRPGKSFESPVHVGAFGLGGVGLPGGPNINLTMPGLTQAVGDEQLKKERENDGASRRGEHAGRMAKATDFQKYRAAIENYDPSVKPGDKTSLNAARSPFATYLGMMHNKIHPLFGDRELPALDDSKDKQFADANMYAVAEIVLDPSTGRIIRRGIVKNSGSTAYDTIVLKVIDSSAPYGKAPEAIVSYDGKVYLHWEFHRNHFDACSTRGAMPIMKKPPAGAQKLTPTPTPPGAPPRTKNPDEPAGGSSAPLRPLRE